MRRLVLLALLALLPAGLGACGSFLASAPGDEAAELVPSSVDLYVSVDGELEGEQWTRARALLERFPRLERVLGGALDGPRAEWNAALGPEVALAVVNLEYREAVALTKPDDPAGLRRLVEEEGGTVAELDGGWWAAAHDARAIERLRSAREADGPLADRDDFEELTGDLPEEAFARIFVRGGPADDALADVPALPAPLGPALECLLAGRELSSAAFALGAEEDGVRLDGAVERPEGWPDEGDGSWTIADTAPERPLFFATAASLPQGLERALACAGGMDAKGADALGLLGRSAASLLSGEVAVAVYPAPPGAGRANPPTVALYAEVEDDERALATVDELAGLASALVPGLTVEDVDVDVDGDAAARATLVRLDGKPVLYVAAARGQLVVSTSERGVAGLLAVHDAPLSRDARFLAAAERLGGVPEGDAFLYLDARAAVASGGRARELEALETLLVTAEADGDTVSVQGFLAID